MYMFPFDGTFLLLIPAIILALVAQMLVKSTFKKYSKVQAMSGIRGADLAQRLLHEANIHDVQIEKVDGKLADHYDPRSKVLRLSPDVHDSPSVAALGIAAHETGHAIQHARAYGAFTLRQTMAPVVGIGSNLAFPLLIGGIFFSINILLDIGILLFAGAVVFSLVTLPVEFNASSRALALLSNRGYLVRDEVKDARKVLNAAAMTYVAATAMAVMQLVRLLVLRGARD